MLPVPSRSASAHPILSIPVPASPTLPYHFSPCQTAPRRICLTAPVSILAMPHPPYQPAPKLSDPHPPCHFVPCRPHPVLISPSIHVEALRATPCRIRQPKTRQSTPSRIPPCPISQAKPHRSGTFQTAPGLSLSAAPHLYLSVHSPSALPVRCSPVLALPYPPMLSAAYPSPSTSAVPRPSRPHHAVPNQPYRNTPVRAHPCRISRTHPSLTLLYLPYLPILARHHPYSPSRPSSAHPLQLSHPISSRTSPVPYIPVPISLTAS